MLEISTKQLEFEEVAVNGVASFRPIRVKNVCTDSITVQLSSSTPLVTFQLRNENYESLKQNSKLDYLSLYNEVFNSVGLVKVFELGPSEEKEVISCFQADKGTFSNIGEGGSVAPYTGSVQIEASRNVPGIESAGASESTPAEAPVDFGAGQTSSGLVVIPFVASVFLSRVDLSKKELSATIVRGKTHIEDFSVKNNSSQPLYFVIRSQSMAYEDLDLELYEVEKLEVPKLGHRILLDSGAEMHLSLMIRVSQGCSVPRQMEYVLRCDNLVDICNSQLLYVSVNVVGESLGAMVSFDSKSVDFGDVYRGVEVVRRLKVQNMSNRENAVVSVTDTDKRNWEGKIALRKDESLVSEVVVPFSKAENTVVLEIVYLPNVNRETKDVVRKKFDLELQTVLGSQTRRETTVIRCCANLYTSDIVVTPTAVNFGDCQVGQARDATVTLENRTALPGTILAKIRSKIISIEGGTSLKRTGRESSEEFRIGPMTSMNITLRIKPQRVNPNYQKQLKIVNLSDPGKDQQVINIESNNMAPLEARLHDELYTLKCDLAGTDGSPNRSTAPALLTAISNVPLLVPYTIQSKVDYELKLSVRTTSSEIEALYEKDAGLCDELCAASSALRLYCIYGEGEGSKPLPSEAIKGLAESREGLLKLIRDAADNITKSFTLEPRATAKMFAVIIRKGFASEPLSKEDGLTIGVDGVEIPRFVRLSYRLCASSFELDGQKTKNFGEMNIGIRKETKLNIVNRCNTYLFLKISKSRSVTASYINIERSSDEVIYLMVRPYATRAIELSLCPRIKGLIEEKIYVTNMLDTMNRVVTTLKANIIKADTFDVHPDSGSHSMQVPPPNGDADQASATHPAKQAAARFAVSNTSGQQRQIIVRIDTSTTSVASGTSSSLPFLLFDGAKVGLQLEMNLCGSATGSSQKLQEQIDKLEQKLKIYQRKGKKEKIEIAEKKISLYRRALQGEVVDFASLDSAGGKEATADVSESDDEGADGGSSKGKNQSMSCSLLHLVRREGFPLPLMGAGESVNISLSLWCARIPGKPLRVPQTSVINLMLYEERDQEANRILPIDVTLTAAEEEGADGEVLDDGAPVEVAPTSDGNNTVSNGEKASPVTVPPLLAYPGRSCIKLTVLGANGLEQALPVFMGTPLLVVRNCVVNESVEFTLLVTAVKETTIVVLEPRRSGGSVASALNARFKMFPRNGNVKPNEPLHIMVECLPRCVGPQKYFIPVKNVKGSSDVQCLTVEINPTEEVDMITVEPEELEFPSIVTPCLEKHRFVQVVTVRSRYAFPHAILIRTNRPSHLSLFKDQQCLYPLADPLIPFTNKESCRFYVSMHPSERSADGFARKIRAGVIVEGITSSVSASGKPSYCVVGKAAVSASCIIGSGEVSVRKNLHDVVYVDAKQNAVEALLMLSNRSNYFPIVVELRAPSPLVEIRHAHRSNLKIAPNETAVVELILHLDRHGLQQRHVDVYNHTCAQSQVRVDFSILRLSETVSSTASATTVETPVAPIYCGENGEMRLLHSVSAAVPFRNYSTYRTVVLETVLPGEFVPLRMHSPESEKHVDCDGDNGDNYNETAGGFISLPGTVELPPNSTQDVMWSLTSIPALSPDQVKSLKEYCLASIKVPAHIRVVRSAPTIRTAPPTTRAPLVSGEAIDGQTIAVTTIEIVMAMSYGVVTPDRIDLGLVGVGNRRQRSSLPGRHGDGSGTALDTEKDSIQPLSDMVSPEEGNLAVASPSAQSLRRRFEVVPNREIAAAAYVPLTLELRNCSFLLPLVLKPVYPTEIHFVEGEITIPPGQSVTKVAKLDLRRVQTQGAFQYEMYFMNELNPENEMMVSFIGQHYARVFRLLSGNDLKEEVHESLTLPTLRVEESMDRPLSEMKLSISVTEMQVELDVQIIPNEELKGILKLTLVTYDTASVVERLKFVAAEAADDEDEDKPKDTQSKGPPTEASATGEMDGAAGGPRAETIGTSQLPDASEESDIKPAGETASGDKTINSASPRQSQARPKRTTSNSTSQLLRLRCFLQVQDLAFMMRVFFAYKKEKELPPVYPAGAPPDQPTLSTGAEAPYAPLSGLASPPPGEASGSAGGDIPLATLYWTHAKIAELESRAASLVSKRVWLGTFSVSSKFEDDEEVQVYGQLDPFRTFSCSSKVTLTLCRVMKKLVPMTPSTSVTMMVPSGWMPAKGLVMNEAELGTTEELRTSSGAAVLGYAGTIELKSTFSSYTADMAVAVLVNERTSTPVTVSIRGRYKSTCFTAASSGDGAPPASSPHRFQLRPRDTVALTVVLSHPATEQGLLQQAVEQFVTLVAVDENVPSSYQVIKVLVAPIEPMATLPRVIVVQQLKDGDKAGKESGAAAEVGLSPTPEPTDAPTVAGTEGGDIGESELGSPPRNEAMSTSRLGTDTVSPKEDAVNNSSNSATALAVAGAAADGAGEESRKLTDSSYPTTETASPPQPNFAALVAPSMTQRVLSLNHCDPVAGCGGGAYTTNFSVVRDSAHDLDINVINRLPETAVQYNVQVISQNPQTWVLLSRHAGRLGPGESSPLQLQILSKEVGSFIAYIAVTNSYDAKEVVYLRLNAEVYMPSAKDRLFGVVAANGGQQMSVTNAVHEVDLGALYGANTTKFFIALELFNWCSVGLEFPVSVVYPFRQELRPIPEPYYGAGASSNTAAASSTPPVEGARAEEDAHADHRARHRHHHHAEASPTYSMLPHAHDDADGSAPQGPGPFPTTASDGRRPYFEGRLVTCQMHGIPTQTGQKYFVVPPHAPLRIAFALSCDRLNRLPPGKYVHGEADVVFRCKQVRDAQFTFRVSFDVFPPTFVVPRTEYEMRRLPEEGEVRALDDSVDDANEGSGASRWVCAVVEVQNVLSSRAQTFAMCSQSEVLCITAPAAVPPSSTSAPPVSWAEATAEAQATTKFRVQLDRNRAAALLNYDKDNSLTGIALREHAFVYNKANPRERVRLTFSLTPSAVSGDAGGGVELTSAGGPSPLSLRVSSPVNVKPIKASGQHFSERYILDFAQRFSATLTACAGCFTFVHRGDVAAMGGSSGGEGGASGSGPTGELAAMGGSGGLLDSSDLADGGVGGVSGPSGASANEPANKRALLRRHHDHMRSRSLSTSSTSSSSSSSSSSTASASPLEEDRAREKTPPEDGEGVAMDGRSPEGKYLEGGVTSLPLPPPFPALHPAALTMAATAAVKLTRDGRLPPDVQDTLHNLFLELRWLADELLFYEVLLRSSRHVEACCSFLVSVVTQHPVMVAWRRKKKPLSALKEREYQVIGMYLKVVMALPRKLTT